MTNTVAPTQPSYWRNRTYTSVLLTHFSVDLHHNSRTLLVALLALSMNLSNAQVGLALLLYNIGSSLTLPFFGWWADHHGTRWPIVAGMGWMIAGYFIAAVGTEWMALVAITFAGIGSGSFHPTGTKVASESSTLQRTQATAYFFMAGQFGLFLGPVMAGVLLDKFGRIGFAIVPILTVAAFVSGWLYVHDDASKRAVATVKAVSEFQPLTTIFANARLFIIALVVLMICINITTISTINFAPKLFAERGFSATYIGWLTGLAMFGSAIGGVYGGRLADRYNGGWVLLLGIVGMILPFYGYLHIGDPWRLPLLTIGGFFSGMPHSILVLKAQSLMPNRRALASGLTLGVMFSGGALGSAVLGVIADRITLLSALSWLALLPAVAIPAAFVMVKKLDEA